MVLRQRAPLRARLGRSGALHGDGDGDDTQARARLRLLRRMESFVRQAVAWGEGSDGWATLALPLWQQI